MRKASLLLTVAAVVTLGNAVSIQQRSPKVFEPSGRGYAQVAAAAMWNGPEYAEVQDQIAVEVIKGLSPELRKELQDKLREKLAAVAKK
jgi:hypothetical protein